MASLTLKQLTLNTVALIALTLYDKDLSRYLAKLNKLQIYEKKHGENIVVYYIRNFSSSDESNKTNTIM